MKVIRHLAALGFSILVGTSVWADDIALVLTNTDHNYLPDVREDLSGRGMATALRGAGFQVIEGRDLDAVGLRQMVLRLQERLGDTPDRVVIVLTGHFVRSGEQVWMLGRDARQRDRLSVGAEGLSVNAVADALDPAQGRALLALANPGIELQLRDSIQSGTHGLAAPQGVTLVRGPMHAIRAVIERGFLQPGRPMAEVAANVPENVRVSGYLPRQDAFTRKDQDPLQAPEFVAELAYWEAARDIGTVEAAKSYLDRYPRGHFAKKARELINTLLNNALRQAQKIETALNLSTEERMEIQRSLSLLGFNPRGIDGVFGRGTRAAIMGWQQSRRFESTGYLNRPQLRSLWQQADMRAAQLEKEARRRQAEQERRDGEFWRSTGQGQDEVGLRKYLREYPDGLFAGEAREILKRFEQERRLSAAKAERLAWDQATQTDTQAGYRKFLSRFPKGQFAGAAVDRIAQLEEKRANRAEMERDKAEEKGIMVNDVTRLLVERRLAMLKILSERQVDGHFNEKTRQAIRRFQRSRNIMPSGYVTRLTMVQLLATVGGGVDPEH